MKLLVLFLISMISISVKAQTLIDTNKVWNIMFSQNFGPDWTDTYKFYGDTTIGSHLYKKLYHTNKLNLDNSYYYGGAMREDSTKKVFFADSDTSEVKLYDFNLALNDTFDICENSLSMIVNSIDTVMLIDGSLRKRIKFNNNNSNIETWIEGIGSLNGIDNVGFNQCNFDIGSALLCFKENDSLLYMSASHNTCDYSTVGIEKIDEQNDWSISPNPFIDNSILTFNNSNNELCTLLIYNTIGQKVLTVNHITKNSIKIEMQEYSSGIYFFQLNLEKSIMRGKFLKE